MATIVEKELEDGSKAYLVKIRLKGFPAQSKQFSGKGAKKLAQQWASSTEAAIREGRLKVGPPRMTLADAVQRYLDTVLTEKRSQRSPRQQLEWWRDYLAHRGAVNLEDVTPAEVARARDLLLTTPLEDGKRRAGATVIRYLAVLSHLFTIAIKEWQVAEGNPVAQVRKPKQSRGRERFLSDDERARLLEECARSNPALPVIVTLAIYTGCRKGELLELTRDRVDLERAEIRIEVTKNEDLKVVPLVGDGLEVLRAWIEDTKPAASALVFPAPSDPRVPIDITSIFKRAVDRAGIEDFHFHDLRHCTGSYLAQLGVPLVVIAKILGHRTLAMVGRYAHAGDTQAREALEKMGERLK